MLVLTTNHSRLTIGLSTVLSQSMYNVILRRSRPISMKFYYLVCFLLGIVWVLLMLQCLAVYVVSCSVHVHTWHVHNFAFVIMHLLYELINCCCLSIHCTCMYCLLLLAHCRALDYTQCTLYTYTYPMYHCTVHVFCHFCFV